MPSPLALRSGIPIDGTHLQALKVVRNEKGGLLEVQRNDEPSFPGFGQVYLTTTLPGVVRAWFVHRQQVDQIALVTGALKVVLYDPRPGSPTYGMVNEIEMDEELPAIVQFPPGIWHGFQATGVSRTLVLHLNTVPFNFDNPDEIKIPPDDPSVPYRW
jgi:dTDP-4-dehydrorhamnose 3,5-epimerase